LARGGAATASTGRFGSDQGFFDPAEVMGWEYGASDDELRLPAIGTFRRRR